MSDEPDRTDDTNRLRRNVNAIDERRPEPKGPPADEDAERGAPVPVDPGEAA